MSAISLPWAVRKSGTDHITESDSQHIILRANNPSEATMTLDNSDGSLMSTFSEEDEVQIKIGSQVMMDAFIDEIHDVYHPNKKIDLLLHLTDFGSYLAAKTAFEKNYLMTTTGLKVLTDSCAVISGLGAPNITGLNTVNEQIKKEFSGTYVKDGWDEVAQNAGADYFVDENKILQAWPFGTRSLVEPSSGTRYQILDVPPSNPWQIMARFDHDITYIRDVTGKYRKVIMTDGLDELYPSDIDMAVTTQAWNPFANQMYSAFFDSLGGIASYATGKYPYKFITSQNVGGATFPTIQLIYPHSGGTVEPAFIGRTYDLAGNQIFQNMGINLGDWQSIRFIMKNALTGTSVTQIEMRLISRSTGAYWTRFIYNDLVDQSGARNNFTFMQYDLPTAASSGTWTKVGNPTTIDLILFLFTPSTGYAEDSYLEFSKFYFYRKQRVTAPSSPSGTPLTQKISVNATITNPTTLQKFANTEYRRVSTTAQKPDFTINGNVNFRMPGYAIDVDFHHIFDGNRVGNAIRIDEIHHDLTAGIHYTELFLDNSYNRK